MELQDEADGSWMGEDFGGVQPGRNGRTILGCFEVRGSRREDARPRMASIAPVSSNSLHCCGHQMEVRGIGGG